MKKLMSKKMILWIFLVFFGITLVGCGKKDKDPEEVKENTSVVEQQQETPEDTKAQQSKEYAELMSDKDYTLHTEMEMENNGQKLTMEMVMQKYGDTVYMEYVKSPVEQMMPGVEMKKTVVTKDTTYVNYLMNGKSVWTEMPTTATNEAMWFIDIDKLFAKMKSEGKQLVQREINGTSYECFEKATSQWETFCFEGKTLKYMLVSGATIKVLEYTNKVSEKLFDLPTADEIITPEAMNEMLMQQVQAAVQTSSSTGEIIVNPSVPNA